MESTLDAIVAGVKEPVAARPGSRLVCGDCRSVLAALPDACVDAVVTDPPYPEVSRDCGRLSEQDWFALMRPVVRHCMRVLKPRGSAVFILQPNSLHVGRMRTWLWEFMVWVGSEYGVVQDAYWWNHTALPTVHTHRGNGLMRPSLKYCVWVGPEDCYRDQDAVLWAESDAARADDRSDRALVLSPSGAHKRRGRMATAADDRGGVTPFNVLPCANTDSVSAAGSYGHGAGTPLAVMRWWTRYVCPAGGIVLDPFAGAGTAALAASQEGRGSVCVESDRDHYAASLRRLDDLAA